MKNLFIALLMLVSMSTYAQKSSKMMVADETWYTQSTNTFKIITSNDSIYKMLTTQFGNVIPAISSKRKTDRNGEYIEYSITFNNAQYNDVVRFLNTINKK